MPAVDGPIRVSFVVGSLRTGSLNRVLAESLAELAPEGTTFIEVPLRPVPFYDGDLDEGGPVEAVEVVRSAVTDADGLIIVTPEYNRSIPAVVKNAIDWMSRPYGQSCLTGKPVGVVAGTPGRHDASGARAHLADTLGILTDRLHEPSLGVPSLSRSVADGVLIDDATRDQLRDWLAGFVMSIRESG